MIPVLYSANESDFSTNGIGILADAITCEVTEERNGIFEVTLEYPADGKLAGHISEDCIIKAKPNDTDDPQLFRLHHSSKPLKGVITWKGEHISYELNANPIPPMEIENENGADVIGHILESATIPHRFTAWSDITRRNNTSFKTPISARKAFGGTSGSVLDIWGGEFKYNNFVVELHEERGQDKGIEIRYGKNLLDARMEKSISDVATMIFPYCTYNRENGEGTEEAVLTLPEKTIDTPGIGTYARERCIPVDFTNDFMEGQEITEEALRQIATDYANSGIEKPKINITASFASLWKCRDYQNIASLEKVGLCDTVTVLIEKLGIAVKAKVVKYTYDSLKEQFIKIEIGEVKTNLAKEIAKQEKETNEQIQKTSNRAEAIKKNLEETIKNVTQAITGNSGGYVVLYPAKNPQEVFIMDKPDTQKAKNVWRWNLEGLGHSSKGINGPYTTAITADGKIVADFITAGELSGLLIKAGTIMAESLDIGYRNGLETRIQANENGLLTKVSNGEISSKISQESGKIEISSDRFALNSTNCKISEDGSIEAKNAKITGGSMNVTANNSTSAVVSVETSIYKLEAMASGIIAKNKVTGNYLTLGQQGLYYYKNNGGNSYSCDTYFDTLNGVLRAPHTGSRSYIYSLLCEKLEVNGSKSRVVKTSDFGKILEYCYEMPCPVFGDIGRATVAEDGICYVYIDEAFSQTIAGTNKYHVFLQKEGEGDIWVDEKQPDYFIVKGTAGLEFSWEIKAKQKGYENTRQEAAEELETENEADYEAIWHEELANYEREVTNYEY